MPLTHELSPELFHHRALRVLIVGAGGTGSAVAMGLPYLDQAVRVWGRSHGFEVTMMDADVVSETNCIRQPFSTSDIGLNKATVLMNRINLFWGTAWSVIPSNFEARSFQGDRVEPPDLMIGCVDSPW
jgi:PRTRC genetic system ThiF family protein